MNNNLNEQSNQAQHTPENENHTFAPPTSSQTLVDQSQQLQQSAATTVTPETPTTTPTKQHQQLSAPLQGRKSSLSSPTSTPIIQSSGPRRFSTGTSQQGIPTNGTRTRSGSQSARGGGRFSWVRRLMNNSKPISANAQLTQSHSTGNHFPKKSNPIVSAPPITKTTDPIHPRSKKTEDKEQQQLQPTFNTTRSIKSSKSRSIRATYQHNENDQMSFLSNDNASTLDNVSTKPILSLSPTASSSSSEDESQSYNDYIDDNYSEPSMKSTAMTSIAPTAFTQGSNNTNGNMIINPGGSTMTYTNNSGIGTGTGTGTPSIMSSIHGAGAGIGNNERGSGHHNTAGGGDSSSVITIASSTRNRRRRSTDTNASTSAIPPASIFERITSVPGGSLTNTSLKAIYPGGTTREQDSILSSNDYYSMRSQ